MPRLVLLSALLLAPLALAAESPHQDAQKVVEQIQAAFNAHDAARLADVFAQDSTLILPDGRTFQGRDPIQKELTQQMKQYWAGSHSTLTLTGVRPIGQEAIWADASHLMTNVLQPDGKQGNGKLHLTLLLEKQSGTWRVVEARPYMLMQAPQQGVGGAGGQ
jgi:uncharacterized protein (TIGR02246 family)